MTLISLIFLVFLMPSPFLLIVINNPCKMATINNRKNLRVVASLVQENIYFHCGHFIYGQRRQRKIGSPLICFVLFNASEHARNNMAIHIRSGLGPTTFIMKSCKHDPHRALQSRRVLLGRNL